MHPIIIILCVLSPVALVLIYIICRELRLTSVIDPDQPDPDFHTEDDGDFEAEVEALIQSRKTKN